LAAAHPADLEGARCSTLRADKLPHRTNLPASTTCSPATTCFAGGNRVAFRFPPCAKHWQPAVGNTGGRGICVRLTAAARSSEYLPCRRFRGSSDT
jgi:hypothetical protein